MSGDKLVVELAPPTVARVEKLMKAYGETTPAGLFARAIGLMEGLEDYLEDGSLLVIDPNAPVGHDVVELVFDKAVGRPQSTSRNAMT